MPTLTAPGEQELAPALEVSLGDFLDQYKEAIAGVITENYPPRYDPQGRTGDHDLDGLVRRPLGAQADAIRATVHALKTGPSAWIIADMGTGKSLIGAASAHLAGCRRVLVLCPTHLVRKWVREVEQTVPGARAIIARRMGDLETARAMDDGKTPLFVIMSKEQAKLGPRWRAAYRRKAVAGVYRGTHDTVPTCPCCGAVAVDKEGTPLTPKLMNDKKQRCRSCNQALWTVDRAGPRRVALADYVRRRMQGFFDLFVADEVQDYKGKGSAQGIAAGGLAGASRKTLTLTGTIFGGYASTIFYLLQRFSPDVRREFGYGDESQWITRYGIWERRTSRKDDDDEDGEDGRTSKRKSYGSRTTEKPGVAPGILFYMVGHSVFLRLPDVAAGLPPYQEHVMTIPMAEDQRDAYQRLAADLLAAVREALTHGSRRLLGMYLQALIGWVDNCTVAEECRDTDRYGTPRLVASAPALPTQPLYPKEQELAALVLRERSKGRRVLVYVTHTVKRDLTPRLTAVLARFGVKATVMKSDTVSSEQREAWIAGEVAAGAEVLICHPKLVSTGLDLTDFPTIVFYQPEYSVYTVRQASRRSWRIGQKEPVDVYHFVYDETLQAPALALIAAKMRAALMVEGDMPEDGLAALEDSEGSDLMLTLARRLAEGGMVDKNSLESLFRESREAEMAAGRRVDGKVAVAERFVADDGVTPSVASRATTMGLDQLRLRLRKARGHRPAPGQVSMFEE